MLHGVTFKEMKVSKKRSLHRIPFSSYFFIVTLIYQRGTDLKKAFFFYLYSMKVTMERAMGKKEH